MVYSVTQYILKQSVLYYHNVTRFHATQRTSNFIYVHKTSTALPAAIFMKIINVQEHCVHISYITRNDHWTTNVGITDT
jgi:hypothetical protein